MYTLNVAGMGCRACETKVTQAIRTVDEEAEVRIERAQGRVEVESAAACEALCAAVSAIGYPATPAR